MKLILADETFEDEDLLEMVNAGSHPDDCDGQSQGTILEANL